MLRYFQRAAFRRFRQGSPGPWGALAVGLFGFRTVLRWAARNEDVVYREVIRPGEQVVVSHRTETRKGLARADKKAGREAAKAAKAQRAAGRSARRGGPKAG